MLDPRCYEINVNGVQGTVEACVAAGVRLLIYTSTYNVIFGGQTIVNGTELMEYFPATEHCDAYSASKSMAERLVVQAHMRPLGENQFSKNNNVDNSLQVCVLRPAAIYGEDEQRHFPRIVGHIDAGIFLFRIGGSNNAVKLDENLETVQALARKSILVDWVHIENLVCSYLY